MYAIGDISVHDKLSSLRKVVGKYTNFDMAIKIFSLAVSPPILSYVFEAVRGKWLRPECDWE